jgi:hypothetical protein
MWKISLRVFQKVVSVDGVTFLREHVSPTGKICLAETKLFQQRKLEQEREERIEANKRSPWASR